MLLNKISALLFLIPCYAFSADVPISGLPAATTLSGSDVVPIVQSGTTKKASFTVQQGLWDTIYQPLDGDLTAIAALTGTHTIYYRSATNTWTPVMIGSGLDFTGATLSAPAAFTPAALTRTNDTNVTLTLGGTPTTALLQATSLTLGWTGQLAQSRGGTGKDTSAATDGQLLIGKTSDHSLNLATLTQGTGITITNGAGTITIAATAQAQSHSVTFVMDGFGSVLTARTGSYIKIPYGGTLTGYTLIGSPSGSITVDIVRATDTNGLPVSSIVGGGGTKPSLSSAVEAKSTSFSGWTSTTLNAFDNLAITTSGITSTTYVALTLYYQ